MIFVLLSLFDKTQLGIPFWNGIRNYDIMIIMVFSLNSLQIIMTIGLLNESNQSYVGI